MKKKTESTKKTKSIKKASSQKTVKKAPRKTQPVKKTAKKKPTRAKVAKKRIVKVPLAYAADWQVFYAVNGAVLRSLQDFFNELETMREDEYLYHKNTGDHFVIWVREVLGDDACAHDLEKATTGKKARTVLKKHLVRYKL
ncbi:MAG: hypothetical protein WDZ74_01500 [Candidatus Paceibacterota bacterium]